MATLTSELVVRMIDQVTRPARTITSAITGIPEATQRANRASFGDRLALGIERNNRALDRTRGKLIDAVGGFYVLKTAFGGPIAAAANFEDAMADVRKVVDFPTPESLDNFRSKLMAISREIPVSVQGLTEIAAAFGQAGLAVDDILPATEAAAKIGTAFDISADQAGTAIAKLMTGLGMTLDETILLTDAMNHLSNSQASSAAEILDVVRRVGAQGTQFGFAAEETAAFASAMIAAGAESEVAATSFRNMGASLTRGASATTRQSDALEKLGLDATDVARRMQEDAVGTTVDVMRRIARLPAELQAAVSTDLFGSEARALGPLLTNMELLDTSLGLVGDKAKYAGSAFEEYDARAQTFNATMQRAKNAASVLGITVGSALLPPIAELAEKLIPITERLVDFADAHPQLIAGLVAATAGTIAFKTATIGLRFAGLLGRGGLLSMIAMGYRTIGRAAIGATRAARSANELDAALAKMDGKSTGVLRRISKGFRGIMLAIPGVGPIAAVTGALTAPAWGTAALLVGGVAAAGIGIYRNWEGVEAILRGIGAALSERFSPAFEAAKSATAWVGEWAGTVKSKLAPLGNLFGGIFDQADISDEVAAGLEAKAKAVTSRIIHALTFGPSVLDVWRVAWGPLAGWLGGRAAAAVSALGGFIEAVSNIGSDAMSALFDKIKAGWAPIGGWLSRIASKINPFSGGSDEIDPVEHRAYGGPIRAGETYDVGERGRERITPERDGWVTSNQEIVNGLRERARAIAEMQGGRSEARPQSSRTISVGDINMSIVAQPGADPRAIAEDVLRQMEDRLTRTLEGAFSDPA